MAAEDLADRLVIRELDIADYEACTEAVQAARKSFGRLDILINNGAVGMGFIRDDHMSNLVTIEEITPETWDRFVSVNFSGAWYLTRAAVPGMKDLREST
jgi:NAD(P)-dependent dehydrogenase (short-subunit alcohol dehydrogenase family)